MKIYPGRPRPRRHAKRQGARHGVDERQVQEMGSDVYLDADKVKESNRVL
jgi:hypothetical protein